ncbi:hypothetical protein [Paraburkholderia dipogonis]|uniref:hypothetical protein n=1 Tax=Paraburkholderia dipogonis TaxID=1211383 RepID=UPI0038BCCF0B
MPWIEFVVHRQSGGAVLVPSTASDIQTVSRARWKHGDIVASEFKRPRNGPHHRRVFGLLRFLFESQERFETHEALRCYLTLQTTYVTEGVDHATGAVFRFPRSWSYSEMDEIEFDDLHSQLINIALREFIPGATPDDLQWSVDQQAFIDGVMSFSNQNL